MGRSDRVERTAVWQTLLWEMIVDIELHSRHCEERSDMAIYPIEPALARGTKLRAQTMNNFRSLASYA